MLSKEIMIVTIIFQKKNTYLKNKKMVQLLSRKVTVSEIDNILKIIIKSYD